MSARLVVTAVYWAEVPHQTYLISVGEFGSASMNPYAEITLEVMSMWSPAVYSEPGPAGP